jgi:hypothetical protein
MSYAAIKTGAALLVIGGFALAAPALAVSPLPSNDTAPVLIPIQDEENAEVWHDLRPDVTPPEAAVGKKEGEAGATEAPKEEPKEEGSGDVEEKELNEDGLIPE